MSATRFAAYNGKGKYAFVSYAHKDSPRVLEIINTLNQNCINIWYDEGIVASEDYKSRLASAIFNAELFVLFISRHSVESKDVNRELQLADDRKKKIIPVFLENVILPSNWQYILSSSQVAINGSDPNAAAYLYNALISCRGSAPMPLLKDLPATKKLNKPKAKSRHFIVPTLLALLLIALGVHLYSMCTFVNGQLFFNVTEMDSDDERYSELDLHEIGMFRQLESLTYHIYTVEYGYDISPLRDLKNLRYLHIENVSPGDLTHLFSGITDASALSGMTEMEHLDLGGHQVSDISFLSNMPRLKHLNLYGNDISDISVLGQLDSLEELDISENNIVDISVLSGIDRLRALDISGNDIIDFSSLSFLTGIEEISFSPEANSDLEVLSGMTNIRKLELISEKITDDTLIRSFSGLTELNMGQNCTDENGSTDLSLLYSLPNLEILEIHINGSVDTEALFSLTNLERLIINTSLGEDHPIINEVKERLPYCDIWIIEYF